MRLLRPDTITDIQSESWPPSPSRHPPSLDEDISTDDELDMPPLLQEEDPLTYFLTPASPKEEEGLEFDFDFDAGIEDSNRSRDIVRSISPSTLDGLKKYKPKSKAASDCAIIDADDDDSDDEDYIRFVPASSSQPLGYNDFFERPRSSNSRPGHNDEDFLSPASFHVGSPRGRPSKRFAPPRRPFGEQTTTRRSGVPTLHRRHSWREPSPDVWSIEEEPEKETMSEMGLSVEDLEEGPWSRKKTKPIDIPAAKPKKKVRFILPAEE
ncbi:hypothetical protein MGN70_002235 [Eutypa lata]|nr:hypothetical protein MGN70_002235 [Eutypa lata]